MLGAHHTKLGKYCENVSDFRAVYVEWCYKVVAVCMGCE